MAHVGHSFQASLLGGTPGLISAPCAAAAAVLSLSPSSLAAVLVPAATLAVLLSIDTLKTCVVLGAMTGILEAAFALAVLLLLAPFIAWIPIASLAGILIVVGFRMIDLKTLELQGQLFFGTADRLFTELEPFFAGSRRLILDFRRVRSVDYTAVNMLKQIHRKLRERAGVLGLSSINAALPGGSPSSST